MNAAGSYIVNMTRNSGKIDAIPNEIVKRNLTITNRESQTFPSCTTADGGSGKCQDLSNCPHLLLDLTKLRQSICFKSLFVPGVCCSVNEPVQVAIQQRYFLLMKEFLIWRVIIYII